MEAFRELLECDTVDSGACSRIGIRLKGIVLYGASYDSAEHFWQAVKYFRRCNGGRLTELLSAFKQRDWNPWLARLDGEDLLANAYAVEFLRHNLAQERLLKYFSALRQNVNATELHARAIQQRGATPFRFSAFEEKVLWGNMADLFHLAYTFSANDDPIRKTLAARILMHVPRRPKDGFHQRGFSVAHA